MNEAAWKNIIRMGAVVFVCVLCFVPSIYHNPNRIRPSNFRNLEDASYKNAVSIVVAMCCPMVCDLCDRLYSGIKQDISDLKMLLLPLSLFVPNLVVLLFCFNPLRPALFYGTILTQVCLLQGLLLLLLNLHDPAIWSDKLVNFLLGARLTSVVCMVVYIITDVKTFVEIYFALLVMATLVFFYKLYFWVREYSVGIVHLLCSRQLELYEIEEPQLSNLFFCVVLIGLEVSYLGFFVIPTSRVTSYNFMCYMEVVAICLVTVYPGQLARRRAVLSQVR
jgi:hypothetical protein